MIDEYDLKIKELTIEKLSIEIKLLREELMKVKDNQIKYDLVDTIENGIIDYCIRKKIKPFSIFEMSIHINDYLMQQRKEKNTEEI